MSRNSNRTRAPSGPPVPEPLAPKRTSPQNPFGIDLVAATENVSLPSEGKFYGPETSLKGVESVEIRHMTAREEDILANQKFIMDGSLFDRLLASILVDGSINPVDFTPGDRNAILVAARITGYGNDYVMKMACPHCGVEGEFTFDLSKQEVIHDLPKGVTFDEFSKVFSFETPKTKLKVNVKVMTGQDEEFLRKQNEKAEKLGLENNATVNLFRRLVASVNDISDQQSLNELFHVLPAIDSRKIRTVINNISPVVSTKQSVACGSCGEESESEVPFSLGFFWPDL